MSIHSWDRNFGIKIHSVGCPLLPSSSILLVVGGVPGQLVGPNRSIPPYVMDLIAISWDIFGLRFILFFLKKYRRCRLGSVSLFFYGSDRISFFTTGEPKCSG